MQCGVIGHDEADGPIPTCLFQSVDDLLLFVAFKVIITETRLRSEWFSSKG
jgi:hypothetical protein